MPLELLAGMVVVGIGLSVLLVRWLFGVNRTRIDDPSEALRQLLLDYPEAVPRGAAAGRTSNMESILVSDDATRALIALDAPVGHFGYVQAFGSKYVTRLIAPGDIRNHRMHGDGVLRIHLKDFTLPRIDLAFGEKGRAARALEIVECSLS